MTWTVPPPTGPWYTARLPSGPSVTVTPLARVSPAGKLGVEVAGEVVGSGVSERKPARLAPVIVRLPVTATAPAGTPPRPAAADARAGVGAEAPVGTERDGHPVRPGVAGREVERRGRRARRRERGEREEAGPGGVGHREVAGHRDRTGGHAAAAGDDE